MTTKWTCPDCNRENEAGQECRCATLPTGQATYCPEDNKLRLYVGRVPRDEYLKLRTDGWVSTPKQREAGGCDFVATWTPSRRDTCLEYAGVILDEDQSPEDRAADRAERFGGYRDKRTDEATGHADRYDAQPTAHGYQSQARAERAAARHDRIADRAVDAWSKAEYWTRRTEGVIAHALYKSRADVRMGRIKVLEADLRRAEASNPDGEWANHFRLRLAYERQMLAAQGERAGTLEMVPGGRLGNHLIVKVCKSNVTGRIVSVWIKGEKIRRWTYRAKDVPGADYSLHQFETERMAATAYTPPTPESLKELEAHQNFEKARKAKIKPVPLINPTEADAEKLQSIWNGVERYEAKIAKMTQAEYSARSGGDYSPCQTVSICEDGTEHRTRYGKNITRHSVFKVRKYKARAMDTADRVVVITDKPQKPLPWKELAKLRAGCPTMEKFRSKLPALAASLSKAAWAENVDPVLFEDGQYLGLVYYSSASQFGLTDKGKQALKEFNEQQAQRVAALEASDAQSVAEAELVS